MFQDIGRFWEHHPAAGITKGVIDAVEEFVKILHHSDFAEYAIHDVFPPSLFVLNRNRTCTAKLAGECSLDGVWMRPRAILARNAGINFTNGATCREQRFSGIEKDRTTFH